MPNTATLTHPASFTRKPKKQYSIRLIDIMLSVMAIELIAGAIIVGRSMLEAHRVHEQIIQINSFHSAVATFHDKYDGIPGDLLAAQAERMGLPTGDGTPSHSDGDGKISPCSPDWHNAIGCESSLFWAQLAAIELIPGTFTANVAFADKRVQSTDLLHYYLPQSTIAPDIFFTVWYSDYRQLDKRTNYIPNGNYYELTALRSIEDSKLNDEPYAIAPIMAKEIDKKIDDGYPLRGKIIVNGDADIPGESWSNYATMDDLECVATNETYNTRDYFKAHRRLCHLAIAIQDFRKNY